MKPHSPALGRLALVGVLLATSGLSLAPLAEAAGPLRRRRHVQAPAAIRPLAAPSPSMRLTYPKTAKTDQTDDYHGTTVADPYRWLEDPDSPETRAWVEAQNKVTFAWLDQVPTRDRIRARLTELWNYERFGLPHKK
jgi:prolyl oligopeptidase